jgi:cell division protein FtsQ
VPKARKQSPLQWIATLLRNNRRTVSGLVLVALLASTVPLGMQWTADPHRFPLSVVEVTGDFRYLKKAQLQVAVAPHAEGGFFTVDVAAIRTAAEALPWVLKASVQRVWPETLRLQIEEQQPIARWGEHGLLNRYGDSFFPVESVAAIELPLLAGPDGQELKVLEKYRTVSKLLDATGLQVTRLELDGRRAWHLELGASVQIELGRSHTGLRLQRLVSAWQDVFAGRLEELQRVDLRYSNGFSVLWQQVATEAAAGEQDKQG